MEVHGWSGVPRDVPLFDSIFIFANYPVELWSSLCQGSLRVRSYRAWESTNYSVNAFAEPGPRLSLGVFYDRARCAPSAIERLLGHWRTLLEAMVAEPERPRGGAAAARAPESARSSRRGTRPRREYARGTPACTSCSRRRRRGRRRRWRSRSAASALTYGELNARANRLARHLRAAGRRAGGAGGRCAWSARWRCWWRCWAILKAGGAYVPLDPAYPAGAPGVHAGGRAASRCC